VLDAVGHAVVGTPVVAIDVHGAAVDSGVTDSGGAFRLDLPVSGALELALPAEGITGIPVEAGKQILIIVP
jgi:hypothetical protein